MEGLVDFVTVDLQSGQATGAQILDDREEADQKSSGSPLHAVEVLIQSKSRRLQLPDGANRPGYDPNDGKNPARPVCDSKQEKGEVQTFGEAQSTDQSLRPHLAF